MKPRSSSALAILLLAQLPMTLIPRLRFGGPIVQSSRGSQGTRDFGQSRRFKYAGSCDMDLIGRFSWAYVFAKVN